MEIIEKHLTFESKGFGGTIPIPLTYTLIITKNKDSATLIICDRN